MSNKLGSSKPTVNSGIVLQITAYNHNGRPNDVYLFVAADICVQREVIMTSVWGCTNMHTQFRGVQEATIINTIPNIVSAAMTEMTLLSPCTVSVYSGCGMHCKMNWWANTERGYEVCDIFDRSQYCGTQSSKLTASLSGDSILTTKCVIAKAHSQVNAALNIHNPPFCLLFFNC